ncbi:MAG TPA: hypothetical protein VLE93_02085 [Candidatus Saccharimonadales bacterium]|nr:hypothetical protein [Candidatus Saccharimonadales bacterium]
MAQANFKIRGGIHVTQHCVNRFKERSNYKQLKRMNGQDIRSKIRQLLKEGHDMDVPQITNEGQRIVKVSYQNANNIPMTLCVILNPAIASKF